MADSGIIRSHWSFSEPTPRCSAKPNSPSITCCLGFAAIVSLQKSLCKSLARFLSKPIFLVALTRQLTRFAVIEACMCRRMSNFLYFNSPESFIRDLSKSDLSKMINSMSSMPSKSWYSVLPTIQVSLVSGKLSRSVLTTGNAWQQSPRADNLITQMLSGVKLSILDSTIWPAKLQKSIRVLSYTMIV